MRRIFILLVGIVFLINNSNGQDNDTILLDLNSSIHLIFPTNVLKADIGSGQYFDESGQLVTDISVDYSEKRLKLAPTIENFISTNLFVETQAAYYSFILHYQEGKKKYVYPITIDKAVSRKEGVKSASNNSSTVILPGQNKSTVGDKDIRSAYNITKLKGEALAGLNDQKIRYWVNGVYVNKSSDKIFVEVDVYNTGNIIYEWGFTGFFIRDKGNKSLKNETVTEEQINPLYVYNNELSFVEAKDLVKKVYIFEKFTMDEDKVLSIEFWEDQGERKVIMEIKSKALLSASVIE